MAYSRTDLTTTAFAYKALLLTQLKANEGLAGLTITYGWPGRDGDREWLFLGEITWSSEDWATMGARQRQEDYEIRLVVNIQRPGASDQDVSESVAALMGVIELQLRSNPLPGPDVGSPRSITAQLVPKSCATYPVPDGMEAQFEASIKVSARL